MKLSNISTSIFQVQNLINLLEQLSSYFDSATENSKFASSPHHKTLIFMLC